jgi:hypothetical protein
VPYKYKEARALRTLCLLVVLVPVEEVLRELSVQQCFEEKSKEKESKGVSQAILQVGKGSPPLCLLSDMVCNSFQVQKLSCLLHVDVLLCFRSVHLFSEWRIQQMEDCPLVNAVLPSGLPLLS